MNSNYPLSVHFRWLITLCALVILPVTVLAHGVADSDQAFIGGSTGRMVFVYMYLGAKHMVTGYDHLLFFCLLYTSPSPRDGLLSRMPSSA